ncbi:MAG: SHOCT domain-containing protein [Chloroflexota bacterium]
MKRFFIWLGVLLIVFAFVVLFTLIILPAVIPSFDSVPPLKATFQVLFCKTGETLHDSRATYNPSPGTTVTTVNVSCVDKEEHERDISGDVIGAGAVGYLVPFLVGLFMALLAGSREKVPKTSTPTYRPSVQAHRDPIPSSNADKEMAQLQHLESATARLKELKSALDSGLISQAEYDAKHKEILGDM